jgi:hypothetical protein
MIALWNKSDLELIAGPSRKGETELSPVSESPTADTPHDSSSAPHGGPALSSIGTSGEVADDTISGLAGRRLSGRLEDLGDPAGRPHTPAGDVMLRDILRVLDHLEGK